MPFRCPANSNHRSDDADKCSACGASIRAKRSKRVGINPSPPTKKKKSKSSSRRCINCGFEMDVAESVCEQCGCQYFGVETPTSEDAQSEEGPTAGGAADKGTDAAAAILQKVLGKKSGPGAPVLHATLMIDVSRREYRPVDESPPEDRNPRLFVMDADLLPFGRVSNWMEIPDAGVSRAHGEFVRQADGSYCVKDTGSQNGITVNGTKMKTGDSRKIKPGDEIIVGFWHTIIISWGV